MRVLVLMRGAPGVGKSTFIKSNSLEQYALSADQIRLLIQSPILDVNGSLAITQMNDKKVWQLLFDMLESRMERGEFTVIDATNSKTTEMNQYKKLCDKYRYRIIMVDFTDVPIDIVKSRNVGRDTFKRVPEYVIDNMYSRFETQKIPSGFTVIKPEQFYETINSLYSLRDFSQYNKIHHIGDIHGCYTALATYLESAGGMKDDELYIFLGDYIDRGIENGKVIKFLLSIYTKPNVILLTGNHEDHLYRFSHEVPGVSVEFECHTKPQLIDAGIDKKELRQFYRKLGQFAFYQYGEKRILVTHGGLSTIPYNFAFVSTQQLIRGVGMYKDMEKVNQSFLANTDSNAYQVHGHRNDSSSPTQINERCYNLCGTPEYGKELRILTLDKDGFLIHEIKNTIFDDVKFAVKENPDDVNISVQSMVSLLRDSKYVQEKEFGNISSFNFTRTAFGNRIWDSLTTKARGLFINTNINKIVARSYNKFFNMNEVEQTKVKHLQNSLVFPISLYVKYNGFLGIVGYDEETDSLMITSKASLESSHTQYFKEIFDAKVRNQKDLKEFLRDRNLSLIFEVIDPVNDPHIIEYSEPDIVLLDAVYRTMEYQKVDHFELTMIALQFGLKAKEQVFIFTSWNEFYVANEQFQEKDYKWMDEHIEGFVVEDASGFMFKLKLNYYNRWKFMRSVKDEVRRCGNIRRTSALTDREQNEFYGYLRQLPREALEQSIIQLRNNFYAQRDKEDLGPAA